MNDEMKWHVLITNIEIRGYIQKILIEDKTKYAVTINSNKQSSCLENIQ